MIDPSVKQDLREISKKLTNLRGLFDLDLKQEMIENFEEKMAAPDFWDDNEKAQALIAEMNAVKSSVDQYQKLQADYDDAVVMIELADEEGDDSLAGEIGETIKDLVGRVEEFELQLLLNQPYDKMNAILELHPGAGVPNLKTGAKCCTACTRDGPRSAASRWRRWIISLAMKRESKA